MSEPGLDRIKALEAKFETHFVEFKQRLEAKLKVIDEDWPSLKVQFAQLSGKLAGHSEEVQRQAGRLDSLEGHLSDWRRGQEQHLWNRFAEMQHQLDESLVTSTASAVHCEQAMDELASRVRKAEEKLINRCIANDDDVSISATATAEIENAIADLAGRVETLEWRVPSVSAMSPERAGYANDSFSGHRGSMNFGRKKEWSPEHGDKDMDETSRGISKMEDWRIGDISAKMEQLETEALDTQSRMEELSVRMVTLKAHQDAQEEHHRDFQLRLDGAVKDDKIEHVLRLLHNEGEERIRGLRDLTKRASNLEAAHVEMQEEIRAVQADAARSMLTNHDTDINAGSDERSGSGTMVRAQELALLLLVEREAGKVAERTSRTLRRELCDGLKDLKDMGSSLQSQITDLDGRLTNVELSER